MRNLSLSGAIVAFFLILQGAAAPTATGQAGSPSPAAGATAPAAPAEGAAALHAIAQSAPGGGLEAAISDSTYSVGPGDSLLVGVWGATPVTYPVEVTLEGKAIIPTVGILDVNGLLLREARARITEMILRYYHNVDITVSLIHLRRFQVHVLGQVNFPGTYLASAVDRVSSAVGWAGGFSKDAGQRHISVSQADSVRAHADLFAFLFRGIPLYNPLLHDGDIIYVPFARERIVVQGAVNQPGEVEFVQGDRFSDALVFSGGFSPEAFPDTIEIVRQIERRQHRPLRFFAIQGGDLVAANPAESDSLPAVTGRCPSQLDPADHDPAHSYPDFALRADDMIFVRQIPEFRLRRLVEIQGEVLHPGQYAIHEGQTRLSDVLRWSGGITADAFLREARVVRREGIREEDREFERLKKVSPQEMTKDEYEYYKLRSREEPGQMVVDMEKLVLQGDSAQDILMQRGDLIYIPARREFVSVLGMVASPGNVIYDTTMGPDDYIARAGGYASRADKGKARIIRASGGEWVNLNKADKVEPGDTIWIPERSSREVWKGIVNVTAVLAQIVTIYLVVDRAINK